MLINLYLWYRLCFLSDYFRWMVVANMLFGAAVLEWAWYNSQRAHKINEERDACFPAFRRLDVKHWNKWKHYPLAVTLFPAKLWFIWLCTFLSWAEARICLLGYKQRPILGWRKWVIDAHCKAINHILHILIQAWVTKIDIDDFDYTEWLGPGYKETQVLPSKVATHIGAPHVSSFDDTLQQFIENHAFCIKVEAKKVPFLSSILEQMQVFYISRNAGEDAVQQIIAKQEAVENDTRNPPIMIMPEGTQSNGKYMLPFKRGAFESLKAVQPIITTI